MAKTRFNFLKFLRSMMMIGLLGYGIYSFFTLFIDGSNKSYSVNFDEITLQKTTTAYVFRKETIVKTNTEGNIKYFVTEGERIKKGQKIGEIYLSDIEADTEGLKTEVVREPAEKKAEDGDITEENKVTELLSIDLDSVIKEVEFLRIELVENIRNGNIEEISALKAELQRNLELMKDYEGVTAKLIESRNTFVTVGEKDLNPGETVNIYSPTSGIVTYYVDDFEDILTVDNIYNVDFSKIAKFEFENRNVKSNKIAFGDPIYKVIDNSSWYLTALIDLDDIHYYDENQSIDVAINGETISGDIISIIPNKDSIVLMIQINDNVKDFYKTRTFEVGLIQDNYKGLKLYKSSIVKYNNMEGVYILDSLNRATFRPVEVIANDTEFVVVKGNYFYKVEGEEKIRYKTVEMFDNVMLEGSKYTDGEIIE